METDVVSVLCCVQQWTVMHSAHQTAVINTLLHWHQRRAHERPYGGGRLRLAPESTQPVSRGIHVVLQAPTVNNSPQQFLVSSGSPKERPGTGYSR